MRCGRCGKRLPAAQAASCPHCGAARSEGAGAQGQADVSGVFQTSAVLIAAEGAEVVYRSMEEVPHSLRSKLLKSTSSANSATILIADRRGREEIARVMRSLGHSSGTPPRRALRAPLRSLLAGRPAPQAAWLTPRRRMAIAAAILLLALGFLALLFTHFQVS
jgi:hypothetical protein